MRVVWVTNLDAPYRRPLWRSLGRSVLLQVLFLDGGARMDGAANRGADWVQITGPDATYAQSIVRSLRVARGEARYYLPSGRTRLGTVDVVVLGGWESPSYWWIALKAVARGAARVGFYESHVGSFHHDHGLVARARAAWFRGLHAVVVPGSASEDALVAMGVRPSRIFQGFNAVDVEALAASASDHRTVGAGHRFLYVGQLIDRKNIAVLLRAFSRVRGDQDTLTIVGVGEREPDLRVLVSGLGLDSAVQFSGYVPSNRLGEVLGSADTLVLPSRSEVWGLVVNEALAAGLHVVVSRAAGVAPSVQHMRGVFLSAPDEAGLAGAMDTSRSRFVGPIEEPEILQYTPERFAAVFLAALQAGVRATEGSWRRRIQRRPLRGG